MQATAGRRVWTLPSLSGAMVVLCGVALTLVGSIGDLLSHTLAPASHAHEELLVLGRGNNPWHLLLFLGIVVTAVGGILLATRLHTDAGSLVAALLVLLLALALGVGLWSGWRAGQVRAAASGRTPPGASTGLPGASGQGVGGGHGSHAGFDTVAAASGAEGGSVFGGHTHGAPGPVSPQEAQILARQLAEAKAATAPFRDIAAARRAGYFQVTQFIPGLGLHLYNPSIGGSLFDPTRPQVLLYEPTPAGGYALVGASWALDRQSPVPPAGFAGGSDEWHYHQNLCFLQNGSVTVTQSRGPCRAMNGVFQARTAWLLHAWLWKPNVGGLFTEVNPAVR